MGGFALLLQLPFIPGDEGGVEESVPAPGGVGEQVSYCYMLCAGAGGEGVGGCWRQNRQRGKVGEVSFRVGGVGDGSVEA